MLATILICLDTKLNCQHVHSWYFIYNDVMWESTRAQKMEAEEMVVHVGSLAPNDLKYRDKFFIIPSIKYGNFLVLVSNTFRM